MFIRGQAPGNQAVHTATNIPIYAYSSSSRAFQNLAVVQSNVDVLLQVDGRYPGRLLNRKGRRTMFRRTLLTLAAGNALRSPAGGAGSKYHHVLRRGSRFCGQHAIPAAFGVTFTPQNPIPQVGRSMQNNPGLPANPDPANNALVGIYSPIFLDLDTTLYPNGAPILFDIKIDPNAPGLSSVPSKSSTGRAI